MSQSRFLATPGLPPRSLTFLERVRGPWLVACLCLAVLPAQALSGYQGRTYVRNDNGSIGDALPNVALRFVKEDRSAKVEAQSDASGRYRVNLAPGRWTAIASHQNYEDYHSAPGFFVVNANQYGTGNFFLRNPQMTTVLVLRHAEKAQDSTEPDVPLSIDGTKRAALLAKLLDRSGITSIYSTDTVRTRSTLKPTADRYRTPIEIYAQPSTLASGILANHAGDVVLVAAHSNTAAQVLNALGASVPTAEIADYDNLFLLTVHGSNVNVTNLQYGADSSPDNSKNQVQAKTLLLVGLNGNRSEALRLVHTARKAGVSAIYTSNQMAPVLAPLVTATGLTPRSYTNAGRLAKDLLFSSTNGTFLIAGTHEELRAIIGKVGAGPVPVLYAGDRDHLIALTLLPSRAARLVHMRF